MPKLFLPVTDTLSNVVRPVAYSVIRDLFEVTGIPLNTFISYPGELEVMQQPGSDIEKMTQQNGINTMPFDNRISIEVDEDYEADRILSTAVYRIEYPFIFADHDAEVGIRPIYSSTDTTINFKFRSANKVEATRWRDTIRTRVSMNWDQRIHKVDYSYFIPIEYLVLLKEIHRLIENVDGYGIDYDTYLRNKLAKKATIMSTMAGTQQAWSIVESQVQIIGSFDFDLVPEKGERDGEADAWTVSFSYKYKYDKPIACTMDYPIMIHNQLLPQEFRNNPLTDNVNKINYNEVGFSFSSWLFHQFQKDTYAAKSWALNGWKGVSIPYYDEFVPNTVIPNTTRVFTALVNIDLEPGNDPALLLNLKQLGNFNLHPSVITYLEGEYKYLTKPGMSPFLITMYRGNELLDLDSLTLDENLNIYSTYVLTPRKYYHIRLSIIDDFTKLNSAASERLRNSGKAARVIFDYLDPSLKNKKKLPVILSNDYVTRESMKQTIDTMQNIISRDPLQFTVQSLIIEAGNIAQLI